MTSRQFACLASCVLSFKLVHMCKFGISEFWPKLTFLLEQKTKFVLIQKDISADPVLQNIEIYTSNIHQASMTKFCFIDA